MQHVNGMQRNGLTSGTVTKLQTTWIKELGKNLHGTAGQMRSEWGLTSGDTYDDLINKHIYNQNVIYFIIQEGLSAVTTL
jgi:hypothetical protein